MFFSIGAAAEADAAFFQQGGFGFADHQYTVFIDGEVGQQAAYRNTALIGGSGLVVSQIDGAFQREAGRDGGNNSGIKIEIGFRCAGDKGLRIEAIAFEGNVADDFIQRVAERVDLGVGSEFDAFTGQVAVELDVFQFTG